LREEAFMEEGVERRHQLALAQISRRTEDHDGGMRHVLLHSAGGSRSGRIDRARRTRRGSVLERGFGRTRSLRVIHGSPSYASSFVAASTTRSAVTPSSFMTVSPGAEAPKRSTPIAIPFGPR